MAVQFWYGYYSTVLNQLCAIVLYFETDIHFATETTFCPGLCLIYQFEADVNNELDLT